MTSSTTKLPANLIEAMQASFQASLRCPEGVAPPAAILWTDTDGQWRPLIPALRSVLPQLYSLGTYDPPSRTGPVIWLKCIVDRTLPEVSPAEGAVPVLYLPGVDRQQLRAAGECPDDIAPLVELLYRGVVWHQRGGRDWTVESFLTSEHGLGLDMALNASTREAMFRSLPLFATEPLAGLTGRRIEAEDFDRLSVGDPIRDVLLWMADPGGFHSRADAGRWKTFQTVCMREFDFDPDGDGPEKAGDLLLHGGGKWEAVWQRFRESPRAYRGLTTLLRGPVKNLFVSEERRPSFNAEQEDALRFELEKAIGLPHHEACERVIELEEEHGKRRDWVWAELGDSPLACSLEPLSRLARLACSPLGGATLDAVIENYVTDGWRCDRAVIDALTGTSSPSESNLVSRVIHALYGPWLDNSARHFQSLIGTNGDRLRKLSSGVKAEKDTCLVFADGLRFDVAGLLHEKLETRGLRARISHRIAPLPTVTSTAKPMASPAYAACRGDIAAENFTPTIVANNQPATAQRLRDVMAADGVVLLEGDATRTSEKSDRGGWTEVGQLDSLGHKLGARLAKQIAAEIEAIADRVVALLDGGWSRVKVVTDHGWLLMPGGLPKVDLPHYLVASRWTRCATVKGESAVQVPEYGWHWNTQVRIASPPGIGSFYSTTEYSHGGISVQECVTPELIVERGSAKVRAEIKSVQWRGMRCKVIVATNSPNSKVDVRLNWKQPATSIVAGVKDIGTNGDANVAIADDKHEGSAAAVVVLDATGKVLDHKATTVGEGS